MEDISDIKIINKFKKPYMLQLSFKELNLPNSLGDVGESSSDCDSRVEKNAHCE